MVSRLVVTANFLVNTMARGLEGHIVACDAEGDVEGVNPR
jgi:hypothetical protein